jgi:hypothetical protein
VPEPTPLSVQTGGPFGFVYAELDTNDGGTSTYATASFAGSGYPATLEREGPCLLAEFTGVQPALLSAGTVTLAGPSSSVTMPPSAGNSTSTSQPGALWSTGDSVLVSASGADVPAFSLAPVAPPPIELTAPAPGAPDDAGAFHLDISRLEDLNVAWNGASSGRVEVVLFGNVTGADGGTSPVTIECTFDGAPGVGVIPASVLQKVPPGPGWELIVDAIGTAFVQAQSYGILAELDVPATFQGQTVGGDFTQVLVTLQ